MLLCSCEKPKQNTDFSKLIDNYQGEHLKQGTNDEFILQLETYRLMNENSLQAVVSVSFPDYRISGNEIILNKDDSYYKQGVIRLVNGIKYADSAAIGFRSLHSSLVKEMKELLEKEDYKLFGKDKVAANTSIFRKNHYSVMFQYNQMYDMWTVLLSKY